MNKSTAEFSIEPLEIDSSEGWSDLTLSIIEYKSDQNRHFIKAVSLYKEYEVGLTVIIPNSETDGKGFGSGISLVSVGTASDSLLQLLSRLYLDNVNSSLQFATVDSLNFVDINKFSHSVTGVAPQDSETFKKYKVFFENGKDDDYAEIYINYSLVKMKLQIFEKDEGFREGIIKQLAR